MTGRETSTSLQAGSGSSFFRMVIFLELQLGSGTLYLHNSVGAIPWGGNDWGGLGDFGFVGDIEEGEEISPFSLTIGLSGIDAALKQSGVDFANEVMTEDLYLRPVKVYIGALNSGGTLDDDPDLKWSGFTDVPNLQIGEENIVTITCESEMAEFDKRNGSKYTDADLQDEYPGDLGAELMAQMIDARVVWRGRPANIGQPDGDYFPGDNRTRTHR